MAKSQYWDKPHARIYAEWRILPSWKMMNCFARALLVELHTAYRPTEENLIVLSDRRAATLISCSRPTAVKAIARLEECGWIEVERVGRMTGAREKRANAYSLTAFPRYIGEAPKKVFLYWRPEGSTANKKATNGQYLNRQRPINEPLKDFGILGDTAIKSLKNIHKSELTYQSYKNRN